MVGPDSSYNWQDAKVKRDMALVIFDYLNNPDKIWDDSRGYGYIDIGSKFGLCKLLIMVNRGLIMDGVYSKSFKVNTKRLRIVDQVWEWSIEEEIPLAKIVGYIKSKWNEIERFFMFLESGNVSKFVQEKGDLLYFNSNSYCLPLYDKVETMVRCMGASMEIKWNNIDIRGLPTMKIIKHLNTIDTDMWNFGKAFYEYLITYLDKKFRLSEDPNFFRNKLSVYRNENNQIITKCDQQMDLPPDHLIDFLMKEGFDTDGLIVDDTEGFLAALDLLQ